MPSSIPFAVCLGGPASRFRTKRVLHDHHSTVAAAVDMTVYTMGRERPSQSEMPGTCLAFDRHQPSVMAVAPNRTLVGPCPRFQQQRSVSSRSVTF